MLIKWHGHSCFEIIVRSPRDNFDGSLLQNKLIWVTDPHDGKSLGLKKPTGRANFITISHRHFDHDKAKLFKTENTKIIDRSCHLNSSGADIVGLESFHDMARGKERGKNIIFLVSIDKVRMAHLGDIGHRLIPNELDKLNNIDIIFIPVGGIFTIGPETAWEIILAIKPRVAVPMHYNLPGLSLPLKKVDDFLSIAPPGHPIEKVGAQKKIDRMILDTMREKSTNIWVFTTT